ncbi:hypothetical protein KKC88_06545 [Patescibacteria group bacterium]|nr:hypothetical protein [Patescibacteria group bacterium]MBU1674053.1 hypothetical protein [Patescibacteria group bacterium]MBU1963114.1 hypothetical protein [Patescibacteria group bacterium]
MSKDKKIQKWERRLKEKLGFLEECGVLEAYFLILAMATNQRDIEILHDLLPENCQVFGEHLCQLRKIRKEMYKDDSAKMKSPSIRLDNDVAKRILERVLNDQTLAPLYAELVNSGRDQVCPISYINAHDVVFSHIERSGYGGGRHFTCVLFGEVLEISVCLANDRESVGVKLCAWHYELTPNWVYRMRQNQALATAMQTGHKYYDGRRGEEVSFWFEFEADDFLPYFQEETTNDQIDEWVAKPGFCAFLEQKLRERIACELDKDFGQVERIMPILTT